MEFNWRVGHLFGGLRNRLVLNTHALRIWVVHLLVYSAPSLQVEHCLGFAGEHLTEYRTGERDAWDTLYIYIYTGCPKSSFLYFWNKIFLSISFTIFILVVPFFDLNIRFVYFRAKDARARVYFPATYFLYFIARIARTPSLFFVINPLNAKTFSCFRVWCCLVVKWSWRKEGFEGKKWRGRPKLLNKQLNSLKEC